MRVVSSSELMTVAEDVLSMVREMFLLSIPSTITETLTVCIDPFTTLTFSSLLSTSTNPGGDVVN